MSKETGEIIKNRIEYWQNKYFKEKEKNKKIKDGILFVGRRNGKSAEQKIILDEYISKDKVREKIEQKRDYIDKELQKANSSNNEEIKERLWCASAMLEELEQELLEERN